VHASAFSTPPVDLGDVIARGSRFKNGEVTLEFKGLGLVDGRPAAVVGFDSGDSAFEMFIKPAPGVQVKSAGASHYRGDLYLDLATRWVGKVAMDELVVAEVTMGDQRLADTVVERTCRIEALSKEAFARDEAVSE
jgi:hypothetical protein